MRGSANHVRSAAGRAAYGIVLWVLAFSTLEQFAELNSELHSLTSTVFHWLAALLAMVAATYEAVTMKGLAGLRSLWERPDPIDVPPDRKCTCRVAGNDDLQRVRRLALKRYGWAFTLRALQRWHRCNPKCLFLMESEGKLVGYLDAFPISENDYQFLLADGQERLITPLGEEAVTPASSFYIASVVVDEGWGGRLAYLLKRAMTFYCETYPTKSWQRVCAIGYSPAGRALLEQKDMRLAAEAVKVQMYVVDRALLPRLAKLNRNFWQKLLP
jgi:hypothetical protein